MTAPDTTGRAHGFTGRAVLGAFVLMLGLPLMAENSAMLKPWSAEYDVLRGDSTVGQSQFSVRPDHTGAGMHFESRAKARGMIRMLRPREVVESSHFEQTDCGLRPLSYRFEDGSRSGKKNIEIDFDAENANTRYKDEKHKLPLARGDLDRMLVQLAIMRDAATDSVPASYRVVDKREIKTYKVSGPENESVDTPAGSFETVRYRRYRDNSSRETVMWLAPALNYIPVRMAQYKDGEETARLVLTSAQPALAE